MGVSLCQWRISIGMYNVKYSYKKLGKINHPNSSVFFFNFLRFLCPLTVGILFGLVIIFTYSFMVIFFLSLFFIAYLFLFLLCDINSRNVCPFKNYFVWAFIKITRVPYFISRSGPSILSFFMSHPPGKIMNILFYLLVLQTLLILSGSIEVNPWPQVSIRKPSFAVWNLDNFQVETLREFLS